MTTAFVLSGGGIRGPLQVGALEALFAQIGWPDLFVGTSAGAINSGYAAAVGQPGPAIDGLKSAWRKATAGVVYPGNVLTVAWRFIVGADGAFPSDGMRRLIAENLPPGAQTFADLKTACYLTSVDLRSGRLYLFGEDPAAPLVDAIMASSSIPVLQPPVEYHGLQLADGGVVAVTPVSVALDKDATTIYAVNVGRGEETLAPVHGMFNIFARTIDTFIVQSLFADLKRAADNPSVTLHHIHIPDFQDLPFNDFSHIEEMYRVGKSVTEAYLANPQPVALAPVRDMIAHPPHRVPGAREFVPSWLLK